MAGAFVGGVIMGYIRAGEKLVRLSIMDFLSGLSRSIIQGISEVRWN